MDRGGSGPRSRTTVGAKRIIALLEDNGFSDLKQYGAPVGYTVSIASRIVDLPTSFFPMRAVKFPI